MLQQSPLPQITVFQPETWLVRPEALFTELSRPARDPEVPQVLPLIEPVRTPVMVNLDPQLVTRAEQLHHFHYKLAPQLDASMPVRMSMQFADEPHWLALVHRAAATQSPVVYAAFQGRSLRYLRQTESEFLDEVALVRRQCGIGEADIMRLVALRENSSARTFNEWLECQALPVYRMLREQGYSHRDLAT